MSLIENADTTVGNYFVSNYPPFSFWKPQFREGAMEVLARQAQAGVDLGIYVHIPFCRKRCHFCYFRVYTDRNSSQIQRYLDAVVREMATLSQQPFVGGRGLKFIYFGGGTPSYLSAKQLTGLTDGLKGSLSWDEAAEITFECEPGTLTENKLRAIRDFGVTRLSLGIENFDEEILRNNNRAHATKEIYLAYEWARQIGFDQINIDLIAGMLGETDRNWSGCVEKAIQLVPDCVTIYQMEIPYNTAIYQRMKEEGRITAPVADWTTKRRWVEEAFAALEAAGYTVGSAYTAVREPDRTRFVYRDSLWQGADMIGLGVSSFGQIGGTHMQNEQDMGPYIERVEAGELPIYRALAMNKQEQLVREFVLQMKLGKLHRRYFVDKFGEDVFERFGPILGELAKQGYLQLEADQLIFSRKGLLRVDQILSLFFLPEHRNARYV